MNSPAPKIQAVADLMELLRPHWGGELRRFYYRGEPRNSDSDNLPRRLIPALLREPILKRLASVHGTTDPVKLQALLLGRLQRYVPPSLWQEASPADSSISFGDRLCLAQHHDLPTLLLDWTLSPLAALYFAATKHDEKDGRVWCMRLRLPSERPTCTCHLEEGNDLVETAETPTLVVPRPFSRRIEVQLGRFIYFGGTRKPLEAYEDTRHLPFSEITQWAVPASSKETLRQELAHLQIHGGAMFPGMEGYARYLSGGGR